VDPSLKFWTVVLPPFANWIHADEFMASTISITSLMPMRFMLRMCATDQSQDSARDAAKRQLLHPSAGMPRFRPPSDLTSSIRGFFAFSFSAAADLIGALINPHL
jgi:hypothetical protein